MPPTLSQFFAAQAGASPNAPFISGPDGAISYREMAEAAARAANVLVELGIRPGDRVAMQVPKCPEILTLYLGIMRAGAILVPLNTAYYASGA